jgi:putative peptidoglycan lipid II flippase
MVKVLTPGFYARQDTRTPVRFAMIAIAVNIVANIVLIPLIAHIGPPLATALASTVNVALLYGALRRRGHFRADRQLARRLPRLALAALLMGAALFALDRLLDPYLTGSTLVRFAALGALVATGGALYAVACFATGAFRPSDLRTLLRRRAAS